MDKDSVFNIDPDEIKGQLKMNHYNYTFLNNILEIDISKYYELISSIELFKIKNIYNFLFLRSLKLHTKFRIRKMNKNKYIKTPDEFDQELSDYINQEKLYSIIIMNGIQQFFIPLNQ
tara:strand:+ start:3134 stop:3487 length:354 start_codon:yes stop_codon:yes gene_type:complete